MICLYARSQKNSGVEFLVGFESESILLNNTNPFEAINDHGWSTAQAFKSVTTGTQVFEEIAHTLALADIELQQYHSEVASRQHQIVTSPLPCL